MSAVLRPVRQAIGLGLRAVGIRLPLRFGSLRRVTPISRSLGVDRGWPIDRYYIERFMALHATDIRGAVLEAGGLVSYTTKFGGDRVTRADVMYPTEGHRDGTIVANLETGAGLPEETFDCLILTQVYPFIYDVRRAVANSFRTLKPGGVVLATVPGISQICRYDMMEWGDFWRFTDASAGRLFGDVFGPANVTVESHGNVLAACAFLHGLSSSDLRPAELDYHDRDYQLSISVRAVKQLISSNASST